MLIKETELASVERKIMFTHVTNAVKLFARTNTSVNMSVEGVYIILSAFSFISCCIISVGVYRNCFLDNVLFSWNS